MRVGAENGRVHIEEMTPAFAEQVVTWRYPPPYDSNDMTGADPGFIADPASGFHALVEGDELIGFRSFGPDGQVLGGPYPSTTPAGEPVLDTGGGLRPDLTGLGLGRAAIATGLAFGARTYRPALFRMTIAAYNARAHRVVETLGFTRTAEFTASNGGRAYVVFTAPTRVLDLSAGA